MAMFEDVNGKPQVVSTGSAVTHTEAQGSTATWSHDGAGQHMDAQMSASQSVRDDGHGHRSETFTKVTETVTHDAKTHKVHTDIVSQSVTKELAPGEAAVDLSKAMDEHSNGSTIPGLTYRNEHQQSTTNAAGHVLSEQHDVVSWDKVGNRETHGGGSNSLSGKAWAYHEEGQTHGESASVSVGGGLADRATTGHSAGASSSMGHSASFRQDNDAQIGGGVGERVTLGRPANHSEGLSAHVSDSLVNHLVSHGYSAQEAHQTVQGVSHTLGQELNGHTMGKSGSVEFHKEGLAAVSLSSETTASTGNTVSVPMDTLKAVHESGISQSLDSVKTYARAAQQPQQASHELSR